MHCLYRTIYWSEIGSNPPKIKKASMDGSGVQTVVLLSNTNIVHTFIFTLDYSQQMLYWMNGSDNCYYTNYIGSSTVDGSGRRIAHDPSSNYYSSNRCYYGYCRRTQAIDVFGGAIYSYSRRHYEIIKTKVGDVLNITRFLYVRNYMCQSSSYMYSGIKVISPEHQLQGICTLCLNNEASTADMEVLCQLCRCKSVCCKQWWLCSPLST